MDNNLLSIILNNKCQLWRTVSVACVCAFYK